MKQTPKQARDSILDRRRDDLNWIRRTVPFKIARALRTFLRTENCKRRYVHVLRRIRQKPKERPVRVLFIVNEIAKFKCQTVFEAMQADPAFEPIIALSAWNEQSRLSDDELSEYLKEAESFFDRLGDAHVRAVQTHPRHFSNLSEFRPDIVFFNEQWAPCPGQSPEELSRISLTCYVPYFVPNYGVLEVDCRRWTQRFSWRYFVLNKKWTELYRSVSPRWNTVTRFIPTGHPGLDLFARNRNKVPTSGRRSVIYAPHWSFPHPKHPDLLFRWSTFLWNGRAILRYAKDHPEIDWIFKPHPLLKSHLISTGAMTREEVEDYYASWEKLGRACYDSEYQNLFLESSAMITDCGTFLTEYGSTGRPLIHLICSENDLTPMEPSKRLYDSYYKVHDLPEMYKTFKIILESGLDPQAPERRSACAEAGLSDMDAAKNILAYLREELHISE